MNKPRKKILYIITKSHPFGGAQRYVYDLATHLPRDQYDVTVALGGTGLLKEKLDADGVQTVVLHAAQRDINILKEVRFFFELYKLYTREQPDTVHLNSSKAGGMGALVGRLRGVPNIVFTSHGLVFDEERHWASRFILRFLTWITFLLSHKIILISNANKERVRRMPCMKHKTVHIYNAMAPLSLLPKEEARAALESTASINTQDSNEVWIGTISELTKNKGLDTLIRGYAHAPSVHAHTKLFVIGTGAEHEALTDLIATLHLSEHVFLLGFIENAAALLPAFDIFTLTSRKEGHPYALLEAGAASLPVIGSNISGITDMIEHEKNGLLIDPNDPHTIATALTTLTNDTDLRTHLGKELKKKVARVCFFDDMLHRTYQLY